MNTVAMSVNSKSVASTDAPDERLESSLLNEESLAASTLIKCIEKTWKWIVAAGLLSLAVAYYWADENRKYSYEVESRLVFNRSSYGAPFYQSPDVHTLAAEFQSNATLQELKDQEGLEVPLNVLSQRLFVNVHRGSGSCELRFTGDSPEDAARLLDRLSEIGMQRVREVRNLTMDQHIANLRKTVEISTRPKIEGLRQEFEKQSEKWGVDDLNVAIEDMKATIAEVEAEVRNEKVALAVAERRLDNVGAEATLVAKAPAFKDPSQALSAQNSPSVVAQRVRELKEEIETQRELAIAEAKLKSREAELARVTELVNKRLMPQSRLTAVLAEVEQLRLATEGNIPTQQLESELDDLNERLRGFGPDPDSAIESIERANTMKRDAEDEFLICQTRLASMSDFLATLKERFEELKADVPRAKELARLLEISEGEVEMKLGLADGMDQIKSTDAHGFSVMTPAAPTLFPVKSNFKKLFVGAFMLCFIGLCAPILGVGLLNSVPSPGEVLATRLQVLEIGSITRSDLWVAKTLDDVPTPEAVKLTSIRLQHLLNAKNAKLVQFLGLTGPEPTTQMVRQLGLSLTKLGEDVVVVVTEPSDEADSLDGEKPAPEISEVDGVRVVRIKETDAEEILSTLNELDLSAKFVLLTGLNIKQRSDVELLALKSNAVILCAPSGEKISDYADDVASGLTRYQAPILGVIS